MAPGIPTPTVRRACAEIALDVLNQCGDGIERGRVVAARRRNAAADGDGSAGRQGDAFDLGAPEVDADAVPARCHE